MSIWNQRASTMLLDRWHSRPLPQRHRLRCRTSTSPSSGAPYLASLPRERRGVVAASALDLDSSPSSKSLSLCSSEMNCSATTTQCCVCVRMCACVCGCWCKVWCGVHRHVPWLLCSAAMMTTSWACQSGALARSRQARQSVGDACAPAFAADLGSAAPALPEPAWRLRCQHLRRCHELRWWAPQWLGEVALMWVCGVSGCVAMWQR